jgi:HK97 family phage portal protein
MAIMDWVPPALVRAYAQARYGPLLKAMAGSNLPSPAGQVIVRAMHLDGPVRTPRKFDSLAKEGYEGNVIVFRAINILAAAIAGIPIRAYKRKGTSGKGAEVDTHPLLDLLAKPNDDMAGPAFMERYVAFLLIAGNSYIQALRPARKNAPPLQLDVLRPDRMRVTPGADGRVAGFEYAIGSTKLPLDKPDVLHTKTFSALDDWYGLSPIAVASRAVDIRNAGDDYNLALLQNSGRPPGFFVTEQKLGDTQYNRMLSMLLDRYTGARMAGLPGLLEQGLDFKASGLAPADMEWGNLSKEKGRDIAIAMGVPSELLGDAANKTYSNFKEARASLYTETALPLFDRIMGDLNGWLPAMYDGAPIILSYDRNDIEALAEDRTAVWDRVNKSNHLTVDEKREATGYEPYAPDETKPGSRILVLSTFATLEDVIEGTTKSQPNIQGDQPVDPTDPNAPPPAPGGENPPKPDGGDTPPKPPASADPLDNLDAPAPSSGARLSQLAPKKSRMRPKDVRRAAGNP